MPSYTMATGDSGLMIINDNDSTVEFSLQDTDTDGYRSNMENMPWAATVNGQTMWSTFTYSAAGGVQRVALNSVAYSQTVVFSLGDTNNSTFGGPIDFSVYIRRGGVGGGAIIQVGTEIKKAIPYVRDNGVWKLAEPWTKSIGFWRQTT